MSVYEKKETKRDLLCNKLSTNNDNLEKRIYKDEFDNTYTS